MYHYIFVIYDLYSRFVLAHWHSDNDLLRNFWNTQICSDKARKYLIGMPRKPPIPFSHKFHNADPSALRLLERLLAFDPKDRPTAEEVYFLGAKRITPYVQLISKAISAHA